MMLIVRLVLALNRSVGLNPNRSTALNPNRSTALNPNRSTALNPKSFDHIEPRSFGRLEPSVVRTVSTLSRSGGMQICILALCCIAATFLHCSIVLYKALYLLPVFAGWRK